jgi:hypothetical protein
MRFGNGDWKVLVPRLSLLQTKGLTFSRRQAIFLPFLPPLSQESLGEPVEGLQTQATLINTLRGHELQRPALRILGRLQEEVDFPSWHFVFFCFLFFLSLRSAPFLSWKE